MQQCFECGRSATSVAEIQDTAGRKREQEPEIKVVHETVWIQQTICSGSGCTTSRMAACVNPEDNQQEVLVDLNTWFH